jgi:hypothetical protein
MYLTQYRMNLVNRNISSTHYTLPTPATNTFQEAEASKSSFELSAREQPLALRG